MLIQGPHPGCLHESRSAGTDTDQHKHFHWPPTLGGAGGALHDTGIAQGDVTPKPSRIKAKQAYPKVANVAALHMFPVPSKKSYTWQAADL